MNLSIQQKREKRNDLARSARNHWEKHQNNWGAKDGENQKVMDKIYGELDILDSEIENEQRLLNMEAEDKVTKGARAERGAMAGRSEEEQTLLEKKAWDSWARKGAQGMTPDEREIFNTLSTTTNSQGGYTVPTTVSSRLIDALKWYGGMRPVAEIMRTTSGENINFPTSDGTAETGEIVSQNSSASSTDPSFGVKTVGSFVFSSMIVTVPWELLQDTVIDLEAFILKRLSQRLGRIQNTKFTVGAGTTEPFGVVTDATSGTVGTTGQTTTIISDDLVNLEHSVDFAYRQLGNCRWMMHDSSLKVIKKLKDSQNRPLWLPGIGIDTGGIAGKVPNTLLGYEYQINNDIATMAANAKSVLFGDFSFYLIREVFDIRMLRFDDSAYASKHQVGFLAFARADGKLLDTNAVKYYANSAT